MTTGAISIAMAGPCTGPAGVVRHEGSSQDLFRGSDFDLLAAALTEAAGTAQPIAASDAPAGKTAQDTDDVTPGSSEETEAVTAPAKVSDEVSDMVPDEASLEDADPSHLTLESLSLSLPLAADLPCGHAPETGFAPPLNAEATVRASPAFDLAATAGTAADQGKVMSTEPQGRAGVRDEMASLGQPTETGGKDWSQRDPSARALMPPASTGKPAAETRSLAAVAPGDAALSAPPLPTEMTAERPQQAAPAVATEASGAGRSPLEAIGLGRTLSTARSALRDSAPRGEVVGGPGQALAPWMLSLPAVAQPAAGLIPTQAVFLPRQEAAVCRQVVDAALQMRDDRVEIRLNPEELGSVRLVLSRGEAGASMTVWVERSDVLDLLRRNAETLLADLRQSGLGDASLSFRDGAGGQGAGAGRTWRGTELEDETRSVGAPGGAAGKMARNRTLPGSVEAAEGGRLDIRV